MQRETKTSFAEINILLNIYIHPYICIYIKINKNSWLAGDAAAGAAGAGDKAAAATRRQVVKPAAPRGSSEASVYCVVAKINCNGAHSMREATHTGGVGVLLLPLGINVKRLATKKKKEKKASYTGASGFRGFQRQLRLQL